MRVYIFVHFSTTTFLPYNVKSYLDELSKHFDIVYLLSNNEEYKHDIEAFKLNLMLSELLMERAKK